MKEDQLNHRRRRRHRLYPPAMPHYYFHVRDEAGLVPDDEGSYFIDLAAARSEAMSGPMDPRIGSCWVLSKKPTPTMPANGLGM